MQRPCESALSLRTSHRRNGLERRMGLTRVFRARESKGELAVFPHCRSGAILEPNVSPTGLRQGVVRKDKADSHGLCMIISQGSGGTTRDMSPFDWDPHCG